MFYFKYSFLNVINFFVIVKRLKSNKKKKKQQKLYFINPKIKTLIRIVLNFFKSKKNFFFIKRTPEHHTKYLTNKISPG